MEIIKTEIVQETISYVAQELVEILAGNEEQIKLDFVIGDDPLRFKLGSGEEEAQWKEKHKIPEEYDAAQTLAFLREKHGISPGMPDELALKVLAILYKISEQSYLAYQPMEIARDVSMLTVAQIEERHLDLPGVNVEVKPIRHYKEGNLAAHVLGYLGSINQEELEGLSKGIHAKHMWQIGLRKGSGGGTERDKGARQVEVNSVGHLISTLGERPSIPVTIYFSRWIPAAADRRAVSHQTMERFRRERWVQIPKRKVGGRWP